MNTIQLPSGHIVIVSDADFDRVSQFKWSIGSTGYAQRSVLGKKQTMHRFILAAPDGVDVDHVNMNRLDNRRDNIRLCTRSQNCKNKGKRSDSTNQFKGVNRVGKSTGGYRARVSIDKKDTSLGTFSTEEAAARAYDKAAHESDPEFAQLNFSDGIWTEEQLAPFRVAANPSSTGYVGVSRNGSGFRAQIKIKGKTYRFGTYPTAELANETVQKARQSQPSTL